MLPTWVLIQGSLTETSLVVDLRALIDTPLYQIWKREASGEALKQEPYENVISVGAYHTSTNNNL